MIGLWHVILLGSTCHQFYRHIFIKQIQLPVLRCPDKYVDIKNCNHPSSIMEIIDTYDCIDYQWSTKDDVTHHINNNSHRYYYRHRIELHDERHQILINPALL